MKKDKHPKYQKVLFVDSSNGKRFVCGSALQCKATETHEGVEYPVRYVSISSYSHPFFIGSQQFVDHGGRVGRFQKRYAKMQERTATVAPAPEPASSAKKGKKKSA